MKRFVKTFFSGGSPYDIERKINETAEMHGWKIISTSMGERNRVIYVMVVFEKGGAD